MITHRTPLPEVIALIPRDLARVLDEESFGVQIATITALRTIMAAWERRQILLDPVTYEGVLTEVGLYILGMYKAMEILEEPLDDDA